MKKVLIITYVFPPVGGAGVQRTLKWTKYLPEFGWEPYVLTARNPSVPLSDESLAREIPASLKVIRTGTLELPYGFKRKAWNKSEAAISTAGRPSLKTRALKWVRNGVQRILLPDPQIGWNVFAYRRALRLISGEKIDAILTSAPPFSTHLLGLRIARRTGIPWVADFRDEWADFYTRAYDFHKRPEIAHRIEAMEEDVCRSVSVLVTVTEGILANYRRKYGHLTESNSFWIPNGFDPGDFSGPIPERTEKERFTLTYSGTVFEVTSARPFLSALKALLSREPALAKVLRVRFLGRIDPREAAPFEDPVLASVVERTGYLPHAESVGMIRASDALLLLLSDIPGAERILTGKVFEYLAARRPVLAVAPEGEVTGLLRRLNAGVCVRPQDSEGIQKALEDMVEAWRGGSLRGVEGSDVDRFSRRNTAQQLADVLNRLA